MTTVTSTETITITETDGTVVEVSGPRGPQGATGAVGAAGADADVSALLVKANNLSDLASASTARTNLGLGTMATATATDYLTKAGNLAGLADLPTARTNLGLGTMATATATDYLTKAGNLAGLADLPTARTNLGLGTAAVADTGTTAGTVAAGDDSRLSDARTPTDGSVSTVKIVDGAVTDAKLATAKAPRTALWLPGTSGNYVTTPDSAGFAITDVDVRLFMSMADWTPSGNKNPVGQWNGTGNQRGWQIDIDTAGRFSIIWSTDGTYNPGVTYFSQQVSTANTFTDGANVGLRFVFDVDNGSGGRTFSVYHRADGDIESATGWTQLGSTNTTAGTTTIHNSTAALDIGACNNGGLVQGSIHRALLLDGIDGTIVASPDFTAPMGPRHRDAQGNIWTINGSAWAWELA